MSTSTLSPEEIREKFRLKARERKERIEQNHIRASTLVQSGDESFEKGNYAQASRSYSDAVRLWNTNVEFYVKLATACLKAEQYKEAVSIATRALTMNPKLVEARYQRGLAFLEQRLFTAAVLDFIAILEYCPAHTLAAAALVKVNTCLTTDTEYMSGSLKAKELELALPVYDEVGVEPTDLSDSEECYLVGNKVACRHYNKKGAGCREELNCKYMHAPDDRSVRDTLGRNVCVYFLFKTCRFGDKCFYSHEKEWLPPKGWWTNPKQIERMKELVAMAGATERHPQRARGKKKRGRYTKQKRDRNGPPTPSSMDLDRLMMQKMLMGDSEDEMDERMCNYGFSHAEVEELMCQGVKPWDDDAWDVMCALSDM